MRALANSPKVILTDEGDESSAADGSAQENKCRGRVAMILTTTNLYERLPAGRDFTLKDGRLIEC
jgi:ABC-type phosphate/phosphonate transport system ATPase subunit